MVYILQVTLQARCGAVELHAIKGSMDRHPEQPTPSSNVKVFYNCEHSVFVPTPTKLIWEESGASMDLCIVLYHSQSHR